MEKSPHQRKNEVLKSLREVRLSNQGKIAMSSTFRTYLYSNGLLTIITELIAILLIFNKLKFNIAFKNYEIKLKIQKKNYYISYKLIIYCYC